MPRSSTKKTAKKTTKKTTKKMPRKSATKKTTKKVVKKKTAKKTTTRSKRANAPTDKGVLVCANGAECFWVTDGQILSNLQELEAALTAMPKEVFAHHTTLENDFANWVEYVLQDCACAADLRSSRTPSSAAKIVAKYVRLYE